MGASQAGAADRWLRAGIEQPESVAEQSLRAAMRADAAAWWRSFQRPVANNDPEDHGGS